MRWAFSICFESIFASIGSSSPSSVGRAEAVEDAVDAVAGEQADEVVLGGEEEARLAGVALAAGAAAELVVDAARLVALGADDVEAAGLEDLLAGLLDARLDRRQHLGEALVVVGVAGLEAELGELVARELLGVAAELDVDAAAGHVGGDRDGAGAARARRSSRPRARRTRAWR